MKFRYLISFLLFFVFALPGIAQVEDAFNLVLPGDQGSPGIKAKGNRENEPDSLKPAKVEYYKKSSDRTRTDIYTDADRPAGKKYIRRNDGSERIFGFSLFTTENLTFEPNTNIPTPKNYRLGPGDDLIIDIWGASQASYRQKITPEGSILIPGVGPLYLSGMTIEEGTGKITKELSSIYAGLRYGNSFIKVSLGSVRSIKVNLVGEIALPGTYTLSSLATVFNALYAANGPSINGSLRDVKVIRNNKTVAELDLYDFLLKGEQKDDIRLEDGDVVFISPYQQRVDITGQVKRPGLFDMKTGESLKELIYFAGGFTSQAYAQRIKIFRKTGTQRKVLDIPAAQQDTFLLKNGDEMVIDAILDKFENRVEIRGAVYRPGVFALDSAGTLRKLIRKADGLKGDAFTTRINIIRLRDNMTTEVIPVDLAAILQGDQDIPLLKDDVVNISPISDLHEGYWLQIDGEVRKPGQFPFMENITMSDLILMAGGFKEPASLAQIEIARRVKNDTATRSVNQIVKVFSFPISQDLKLTDSASRFVLKPFDVVSVRRSPGFGTPSMVRIDGEVLFPGSYSIITRQDRISDLIGRAGSITQKAWLKGTRLTRADSKSIPVDLAKILKNPGSKDDLFLVGGDVFIIPIEIQTVKVTGEVMYPNTLPFQKGKGLRAYLNRSGGFSPDALKTHVYVINANGSVNATKPGFLFIHNFPKIEPGATIVVPKKK
jgi:protein involved in polysaccharide export with SLBB domain